ncbi:long-chain acyl-CoA synthetase [Anaerobacterium chartisolvens]|uniref:Long-chain acyl-CoA synthetase n=1 Tax=Anaerobacterium chartisolvens TaxID=1297424 RepID=A0A369B5Y8_9FIRM|nr:AMP-binding protein [Anaerobacterium chartisolvens]RCX16920.1 long-chain acyl-CoA synthetase [Anaerobacterium chartisolvens]
MVSQPIYSVRPIKNLKDMLEQSADLYSEKDAFLLKEGDNNYRGIKYCDFKRDVDALGTALLDLGLKDKFIAVIGENRYEWGVGYMAVVNGTGVAVPLDRELPLSEIENLIIRSDTSAIIFSEKLDREMRMLSATLTSVKYFIRMDYKHTQQPSSGSSTEGTDGRFISYTSLIERGRMLIEKCGNRAFVDSVIDVDKMSILLFTSGTTDLAKGVMLSHKNICSNIMATCSVLYLDSNDSVLSILPIHHTYECTNGFLLMLYNGCTISFCQGLKHIPKNLKEVKCTILLVVPLILENLYKKIWEQAGKKKGMRFKLKAAIFISDILYKAFNIDIRKKLFRQVHESLGGRVRLVISGAAAIDPRVSKGLGSMGIRVIQGYGLTECSPIVTVNRDDAFKDASIGHALPGTEVRIENPNSDGIGEIAVKGDHVMLGYFENSLATEKVLKGGWFYTGDLGRIDDFGFFYVTGRKKNVIVTKNGKNIFPEEVEAYLNKSPYIQECLIWGKYEEMSGETYVSAQIVPYVEAIKEKLRIDNPSQEDILKIINLEVKAINSRMPLYKRIRKFTVRENEFEKTTTKKIKRYIEKIS